MGKTLIKGGTVVTMDPSIPDLEKGDVLIDGTQIAAVSPDIKATGDTTVIDAANCIVMPGLINAHLHTWQTGLRGIAADWTVPRYMQAMHRGLATFYTPEDIHVANLVGALNQLNLGCTTIVDWCHNNPTPEHTDAAIDGLETSGARAVFLHGSPKPSPKPGQKHFSEVPMPRSEVDRLRKGRLSSDDGLVTLGLALLGPQYSVYDVAEQDMRLAKEYDLLASIHTGGGTEITPNAFARILATGLVDRRLNIVHANNFSDEILGGYIKAGATITVTADVEMQMGFGNPVMGRARAFGSPVSIGIDVEPAVSGDLFAAMRFTLQVQRNLDLMASLEKTGSVPDRMPITCREALKWATVNAAYMIRQEDRLGSLAPGKQADVILIRGDDLNLFPIHDAVSSIVMQVGGANVDSVFVAGKPVKQGGRLLYSDLARQKEKLRSSGRRIRSQLESATKAA